jgi:hypothetical protein
LRLPSLSHDELKAAEAAFRGRPCDSRWSERAQAVYEGIWAHTNGRDIVEAKRNSLEQTHDPHTALVGANI